MKDVTILIPSYNEEKFIEQAIVSAVSQAEYVIVSDNCSDDGTLDICKMLAKKFNNLIVYEQKKNIGLTKNFEFLLLRVKTKYVLHVGAHDYISDNYVLVLKEYLENNKNAVIAYTPYFTVNENSEILDEELFNKFEDRLTSPNISERIFTLIERKEYIFTIYGLCRTEIMKKNYKAISIAGLDCLVLSYCLNDGIFIKVSSERFYRRVVAREESTEAYMKRLRGNIASKQYDLSYMCTNQFKLLKEINKDNLEEQKKVLIRATMSMQRLYGKYCHKSLDITLEKLSKSKEKYILYGAGTTSDYILEKLPNSILFIVDQDITKQNTSKNGIEIKSPTILNQYENKIIISLLGRFELISEILINEYKINSLRFILPIDYKYKISS